jgi:hypothetical protein
VSRLMNKQTLMPLGKMHACSHIDLESEILCSLNVLTYELESRSQSLRVWMGVHECEGRRGCNISSWCSLWDYEFDDCICFVLFQGSCGEHLLLYC